MTDLMPALSVGSALIGVGVAWGSIRRELLTLRESVQDLRVGVAELRKELLEVRRWNG